MREADGEFFDELAVRVFVEDASAVPAGIRQEIGGVAICIVERQFQPAADTARYNDLRGGMRIELPLRGFGTLGALLWDNLNNRVPD